MNKLVFSASIAFLFLLLHAGKYFADFEIPRTLDAMWSYMGHMYKLDAFTQSCPADQDIINHYKLQQGTKVNKHEELETPTFTISLPADLEFNNGH